MCKATSQIIEVRMSQGLPSRYAFTRLVSQHALRENHENESTISTRCACIENATRAEMVGLSRISELSSLAARVYR